MRYTRNVPGFADAAHAAVLSDLFITAPSCSRVGQAMTAVVR